MAFSINIPYLLRLTVIRTPAEAAAIDDAARVDRPISGRGGLINRAASRKLAPFTPAEGPCWPAFASRLNPTRAAGQAALEQKLRDFDGKWASLEAEIKDLGRQVRGQPTERSTGVLVQQVIGRLFFDDFTATEESYAAAVTVSGWIAAGPIKTLYLRCSGKFQAALDRVIAQARGNLTCAHGIGLAMHNIVDSVTAMRKLARSEGALREIAPEQITALVLSAPARVVREAQDGVVLPNAKVRDRALVMILVDAARRAGNDPGAFFVGHWNQCPAHAFVPALLSRIWLAARTAE